jgi:hypothetical protein
LASAQAADTIATAFGRDLEDPAVAVAIDERGAGSPVLVCFGGLWGGLSGPPFEFLRMTSGLDVTRVFIRDLEQAWYQRGISGLGRDVTASAEALGGLLDRLDGRPRVFAGTSAGGFGAMLFGSLIGADRVVAFSPQTTLRRASRLLLGDRRWPELVAEAQRAATHRRHLDLVRARRKGQRPDVTIFYGTSDRLDAAHATRMARSKGVRLAPREGGHEVARTLRDNGELMRVLTESLMPA